MQTVYQGDDKDFELWVCWNDGLKFFWVKSDNTECLLNDVVYFARQRLLDLPSLPLNIRLCDSHPDRSLQKQMAYEDTALIAECIDLKLSFLHMDGTHFFKNGDKKWTFGVRLSELISQFHELASCCNLELRSISPIFLEKGLTTSEMHFSFKFNESTDVFWQRLQLFYLGVSATADARQILIDAPRMEIDKMSLPLF